MKFSRQELAHGELIKRVGVLFESITNPPSARALTEWQKMIDGIAASHKEVAEAAPELVSLDAARAERFPHGA